MARPNILLITADQWRGDCLGALGHVVRTPSLDRLAQEATLFENHFATCAPCSPARASLYTGLYQMNHRVVWNGAGLDARFDNIALLARRAGYLPTLFGYTDTAPDPRLCDPGDPALSTYEGVLPGFDRRQGLDEAERPWITWLGQRGHDIGDPAALHRVAPEPGTRIPRGAPVYGADETQTAFLANAFLDWQAEQDTAPWFAHLSFLRPHPPFVVPAPYNTLYDAGDGPDFARHADNATECAQHPLVAAFQAAQGLDSFLPGASGGVADLSDADFARLRAVYFGLISEVDAQLGRIFDTLRARGAWDDTLVIFTSDHGEMMGDHRMLGKGGLFPQSYHIPLILRVPGGAAGRVTAHSSAADILPTLADLLAVAPRHAPDGASLLPFVQGVQPTNWRDAAIWEFDMRHAPGFAASGLAPRDGVVQCRMDGRWLYAASPALPPALYDLQEDPHCLWNRAADPACQPARLQMAEALLADRARLMDATLARACVWDWYG